jgi:uncharacterized membrane protein
MKPEISPLDRPPRIPVLRRLLDAGLLAPAEEMELEGRVRRALPWRVWLDRGLLSLGVVLILAGIGDFFAHNWRHLTDAVKLGLAGGAVALSFAGAVWAGFDRFPGKLLLLAASALVGVFIGVFGQVYQTGADTYELFTAWAFFIFPWVVLGRFMPLWTFWVGVLNCAVGFYWPVARLGFLFDDWSLFRNATISLFMVNGAALLAREIAGRRPPEWFDGGWSKLLLLAATIAAASVEAIAEILHTWDYDAANSSALAACVLYAGVVVGTGYYYSRVRYSLPSLAMIALGACTTLTFLVIRVFDLDHNNGAGALLFMGIIILAIFGGGVFFLRTQRPAHQHRT